MVDQRREPPRRRLSLELCRAHAGLHARSLLRRVDHDAAHRREIERDLLALVVRVAHGERDLAARQRPHDVAAGDAHAQVERVFVVGGRHGSPFRRGG
jgi:hypothetical protein